NAEIVTLQEEMTAIILDLETAGITEKVYLKIRSKEINSKTEIINRLLEELEEEKAALKISYVPLLRESQAKDRKVKAEYNVNAIVERYKWEMFNEIAEIGKGMQSQYNAVAPDLMEILD